MFTKEEFLQDLKETQERIDILSENFDNLTKLEYSELTNLSLKMTTTIVWFMQNGYLEK